MRAPEVSVIIVSYRDEAVLVRCLESLYGTLAGVAAEVIVVDNASGSGGATGLSDRFPGVRLLLNTGNVGFARATNQGIGAARGELLLWLNPDTVVTPGALPELIRFFRDHPDAGAVGPKLIGPDGSLQYSCRSFPSLTTVLFTRQSILRRLWPSNPFSRRYLLTDWDHGRAHRVDWVSGAALLTSRAVVERVGPLDEQFFVFHEDVDWCRRVHLAGRAVYYDPQAVLVHDTGISNRRLPPRLILERHRGMLRYYRKHMRRGPWLDVPILVGVGARAGLQLLTRSRWRASE